MRVTAIGICGSDLRWLMEAGIGNARLENLQRSYDWRNISSTPPVICISTSAVRTFLASFTGTRPMPLPSLRWANRSQSI
ncbi:MAG: hypothetical protein MUO67_22660 [Anaerolineales bacterium]|nr:hypothetical protein [Anaerolineales bacterium]